MTDLEELARRRIRRVLYYRYKATEKAAKKAGLWWGFDSLDEYVDTVHAKIKEVGLTSYNVADLRITFTDRAWGRGPMNMKIVPRKAPRKPREQSTNRYRPLWKVIEEQGGTPWDKVVKAHHVAHKWPYDVLGLYLDEYPLFLLELGRRLERGPPATVEQRVLETASLVASFREEGLKDDGA